MSTVHAPEEVHLEKELTKELTINHEPVSSGSSQVSSKTSDTPPAFNPGWRFKLAFASLSIVTLMVALDATSLSVALPIMAKTLGGSAIEAFWSGTSFLLTSTVFQPVIGNFSHIFGRKPMILGSLVLFGVGAIIAALAKNFTVILVGRSVQGIGGGGVIALTEIIACDLVPLRERGKWFAFISSMWALGKQFLSQTVLEVVQSNNDSQVLLSALFLVVVSHSQAIGNGSSGSICLSSESAPPWSFCS